MTKRIHRLSPLIINQIAAGEVIERPASVVKELLENAIDANASQICVRVFQGGISSIEVTDNGDGIHADDMVLSIMRHATSKIASDDVLSGVHTLGFRGEALASICAVARVDLESCQSQDGIGMSLQIAGHSFDKLTQNSLNNNLDHNLNNHSDNDQTDKTTHDTAQKAKILSDSLKPVAMARGTKVLVKDLFFNVPARRRFLKSIATEFGHIESMVKRLALSFFDIGFELWHQGQLRFSVKPAQDAATQKKRLAQLLDADFAKEAKPIHANMDINGNLFQQNQAQLSGWLSLGKHTKHISATNNNSKKNSKNIQKIPKKKSHQYWFVNGRLVQNRALKQLVQSCHHQAGKDFCDVQVTENLQQLTQPVNDEVLSEMLKTQEELQLDCENEVTSYDLDYVLFLTVPESEVNVNIHPTKLDIRLENEQQIHLLLSYYLKKYLQNICDEHTEEILASLLPKADNADTNLGQLVYWQKNQMLSQCDDGFMFLQFNTPLNIKNDDNASEYLTKWQTEGVPQGVSVNKVPFDEICQLLKKQFKKTD